MFKIVEDLDKEILEISKMIKKEKCFSFCKNLMIKRKELKDQRDLMFRACIINEALDQWNKEDQLAAR